MRAYKCDICEDLFEVQHMYRNKDGVTVRFSGSGNEPFYDVCKTCAQKVLLEIAEETGKIEED